MQDPENDIEGLFARAVELGEEGRADVVAQIRETHPELAEELERLLRAHDANPAFLERGIDEAVQALLPDERSPGGRIGPYQVVRELGSGGMGVVCLARRVDGGFEQYVAIKFARWGLSPEHLKRLASEREILARLKHPGIAPLYGGGVTDGRPYLVMEYIDGDPITNFCAARGLGLEARLDLIMDVCDAVQFAHQNLVIHRDLKPSNILVDGDHRVRLLDFGIAKLLAPDPGSENPATVTGTALTPAYSAPEQLRREAVTTATDVFSLGVLAYELLTGQRPFDLHGLSPAEIERMICETEPVPPSAASAGPFVAEIDEDLDTVIMKALRKEPKDRYESARALADDIKRYLRGMPVVARAPSRRYRLAKFARRNKVPVASGVIVGLALVAAVGVTSWQARVASQRAVDAARERDNAQAAAARAESINRFLQGVLATANPSWYVASDSSGPDVTVLAALEEAARRMDEELADDPGVRSDIHHTLGDTYRALLRHDLMVEHFEASLALRREAFAPPHPKIAEALYYLSAARSRGGRLAEALPLLEEAVAMQRERDEGNNLPFMVQGLALSYLSMGRIASSLPLLDEAAVLMAQRFGPEHRYYPSVSSSQAYASLAYSEAGDAEAARAWADSALAHSVDIPSVSEMPTMVSGIADLLAGDPGGVSVLEAIVARDPKFAAGQRALAEYVYVPRGELALAIEAFDRALDALPSDNSSPPSYRLRHLEYAAGRAYVLALSGDIEAASSEVERISAGIEEDLDAASRPYWWSLTRLLQGTRGRIHLDRGRFGSAEAMMLANLHELDERGIGGMWLHSALNDLVVLYTAIGDVETRAQYLDRLHSFELFTGGAHRVQ